MIVTQDPAVTSSFFDGECATVAASPLAPATQVDNHAQATGSIGWSRKQPKSEGGDPHAAYAKFLRGEKLVESTTGFSSEAFQAKMRRIQAEAPDWTQKSGQQAKMMPMMQKLQALVKDKKWQEADKQADEVLSLLPRVEKKWGAAARGAE
jgi:hypothetical protein